MNHIVIIGFMGSGKTRVGKRLAKDLGLPFIDVDRLIVKKMNMSVKEVFERFGEPFYRALETMAVKELSTDGERKVISVSAGLPLQEQRIWLQTLFSILNTFADQITHLCGTDLCDIFLFIFFLRHDINRAITIF